MSFKIAFIGAGGVKFTRTLLTDILSVPEFHDLRIAFTDIDEARLKLVTEICQRDIDANKLSIKIEASTDRREALDGARYVFSLVRIGGLEAFQHDIDIPLKYGVDQCVGDTLSAGGILYAQRGIPAILDFCRDIADVCEPGARLFNYANPMAMLTWATTLEGSGIETIGLCHGVQGSHKLIAEALGIPPRELHFIAAGINHQTWFIRLLHKGQDKTSALLAAMEANPRLVKEEPVRIDMLRRYGYFSTESNGHLSEYLPWYRSHEEAIRKWIGEESWINGETGGYLRVCREGSDWFESTENSWRDDPVAVFSEESRSEEHGSRIIEALETGRAYRGTFNVPNNGILSNLPADAIIESPGYVDALGINMIRVGDLPDGCAAVCQRSIDVQCLSVKAALKGDIQMLRQAMLMDPLNGAVCTPAEIDQMTDEMLVATAKWLPQYREEIPRAKERLSDPDRRVPTRDGNEGAFRRRVRAANELSGKDLERLRSSDMAKVDRQ